jgi:hypothetical protein
VNKNLPIFGTNLLADPPKEKSFVVELDLFKPFTDDPMSLFVPMEVQAQI